MSAVATDALFTIRCPPKAHALQREAPVAGARFSVDSRNQKNWSPSGVDMKKLFAILAASAALSACAANGDTEDTVETAAPAFQQPIDYIPSALGPYSWKVSTDSDMAQKYFDQGLQMRYAYGMNDAARSFRMAHQADPDCAMCYWGEAYSLGSYLNGGMTAEQAPYAHEAIEKAVALSGNATERERDLIMAARDRYPADYDPENRRPVDEAFAERMKAVYDKYPGNHEVAVVYAVSLFLLEERRGYRDVNDPDLIHLHAVLTGVLDEDITHPGACHLYIHATESSQQPELALPCAEYLSDAIPAASHIQHMPSHTWNEVGYWGRSVNANINARHSDLMAREGAGFSYAANHNLHMLLFAASMDGQGAVATQAGKDYAKETGNSMYYVLTLLRFGRYDEIPGRHGSPRGRDRRRVLGLRAGLCRGAQRRHGHGTRVPRENTGPRRELGGPLPFPRGQPADGIISGCTGG